MITTKGKRGKSKAEVTISIDTVFNGVALHVWEGTGGKKHITHTFYPTEDFLRAMVTQATAGLAFLASEKERIAKL